MSDSTDDSEERDTSGRAEDQEVVVVRCPACGGLRGVTVRQARRADVSLCRECFYGRVVPCSAFREFWTSRFSGEEIEQMARAIWG